MIFAVRPRRAPLYPSLACPNRSGCSARRGKARSRSDTIAVSPARQGLGLGRQLLAFAEAEALRRGYREIRLYTHQTMVENQRLYASIGYEETGRGSEAGYNRVFMRKQLRD